MVRRTKSRSTIDPTSEVKGDDWISSPLTASPRCDSMRTRPSPRRPALPVTRTAILELQHFDVANLRQGADRIQRFCGHVLVNADDGDGVAACVFAAQVER